MNPKTTDFQAPATESSGEAGDSILELIAAALRGEPLDLGRSLKQRDADDLLEAAAENGVGPLLHHALASNGGADEWPDEFRQALAESARREETREAVRVEEIRRVLAALDAEGVAPVVLKGTALAYSVYPRPQLRACNNADLLVRQGAVAEVVRILGELGYRRHHQQPGKRVLRQDTYLRQDDSGDIHALDLHWAISNRPDLANGLDYADIRQRAVAIEALSPCAMAACHEDALLHACLHRPADGGEEKLIRLYDIHLLAQSMTAVEFERFAQTAMEKHLGQTARDAIAEAQRKFCTELPSGGLEDYFSPQKLAEEARSGLRLSPGRRFRMLLSDIGGFGRVRETLAWARGRAFPPSADTGERHRAHASIWLPALHIRRGLESIAAFLKRSH